MFEKIRYDQRYVSLLTVYRCCSYTLAADKLALTPSAVSQQIHSVERELNTKLFILKDKKLCPTSECQLVAEYIDKIQAICRQISEDIDISKRHIERLTIGVTQSVENFALSGILPLISDKSPKMQLKITSGCAEALCKKLANYEIDIAVIEGGTGSESFGSVILDTDYLTVAVPYESKWASDGIITLPQLLNEKLIMKPRESGTRKLFESSLRSAGIQPEKLNVIMEAENVDTIVRLVSAGYGISVLSRKACLEYVKHKKIAIANLEGINMSRSIQILYRKDDNMKGVIGKIQQLYHRSIIAE